MISDSIDLTEKKTSNTPSFIHLIHGVARRWHRSHRNTFTEVHRSSPKFTGVHRRLPPISPKNMYMCCDYRVESVPTEVHRSSPKFTEVYSHNLTDVAHCMQKLSFVTKASFCSSEIIYLYSKQLYF